MSDPLMASKEVGISYSTRLHGSDPDAHLPKLACNGRAVVAFGTLEPTFCVHGYPMRSQTVRRLKSGPAIVTCEDSFVGVSGAMCCFKFPFVVETCSQPSNGHFAPFPLCRLRCRIWALLVLYSWPHMSQVYCLKKIKFLGRITF